MDGPKRQVEIDPRRLLTLRAVAQRGSLAAAARALGLTQPAVSQQMVELERSVGRPVLRRSWRGVELTGAGQALVRHAEAIASHLEAVLQEVTDPGSDAAGRLTVAAYPTAGKPLVMPALSALATRRPNLGASLIVAEPDQATELLRTGSADLAIVFSHQAGARDREFQRHHLFTEPTVAIVPANHPLAAKSAVQLSELREARWIAGCERCREHLIEVCAAAGFQPDIRHQLDDFVLLQHLVAEGFGVALIPSLAFRTFRHPDVAVLESPSFGSREIYCLTRRDASAIPTIAALLGALHDAAEGLTH